MPEATLINSLLAVWKEAGIAGVLAIFALSAFVGDRRKNPPPAPRDEKHDENRGMGRETQAIVTAGFNETLRALSGIEDKLDRALIMGEIIKDRTER